MTMIRLRVGEVLEISFPGPTPKIELRMKRVAGDTVLYDVSAPPYVKISKWEDRWEPTKLPGAIKLWPAPQMLPAPDSSLLDVSKLPEEDGDTAA